MKTIPNINPSIQAALKFLSFLLLVSFLTACENEDPQKEDVPELITKATLTFTPEGTGGTVIATATDPDGEGVKDITVDGPINLAPNRTYKVTIALVNGLASPTSDDYDITKEVRQEGDEHMFFFSWTNDLFSNPAGNGNIDNRNDAVNYSGGTDSKDSNNRPLGLTTTWTTASTAAAPGGVLSGVFRVLLKHQPELKSDTSTSGSGETDLDISFMVNIQ